MTLKTKLISSISAFVLILTMLIVGVWAASTANVTLGGTIGFQASNVYAKISATITGMDENPTLPTLIFSEGSDASSEKDIAKWNELALVFNSTGTPIEIEVTLENLSDERALYAKIDDQIGVVANLTKTVTSSSQDALGRYIEVPISSSISYTITLSPTDPNKSVNGEYRYLMTLVDETEIDNVTANIQVSSNQSDLGSVSGSGLYAIGDTATLRATRSGSNTFLAWATSTDPNTMEIVSIDATYSFEVSQDSPRTFYALFNSTTSTSQTVGDLVYTFYNEAKLAEITGMDSSFQGGDYTISPTVTSGDSSYRVYSIGNFALSNNSSLTSISIPEGVVSIGNGAFETCESLTSISIPESLKKLGDSVVNRCNALIYYTDSDNNKYLGNETNNHLILVVVANTTITEFNFPEGCRIISDGAFRNCTNLTSIDLPSDITTIGGSAFSNCSNLSSISIPEGVTEIRSNTFNNCNSLTSISLPTTLTLIGDLAFQYCTSLISINIPEGIVDIGSGAFADCSSLASVTLPASLTELVIPIYSRSAFTGCFALKEIILEGNIETIDSNFFGSCSNLTKLTLGSNVTTLPSNLFTNSNLTNLTEIVVEAGSTLSAALPTYGTWVKDGGSETVTNFSGAGTYTRTDV